MNIPLGKLGYVRVSVVSPEVRVADVRFNTGVILGALEELAGKGTRLGVFPELSITGYSCGDLLYQAHLREQARLALLEISRATSHIGISAVVGLPLEIGGIMYNCAALVSSGEIVGIIPKVFIPNTNEFYEKRWFSSGEGLDIQEISLGGEKVPVGVDLLFRAENQADFLLGMEICADLWSVNPPSGDMALAGATVLVNPSASNELLAKAAYRKELVKHQSARSLSAYLYACSGPGESTTDVVYAGHSLIAENGTLLGETPRFQFDTRSVSADIDLQSLVHERLLNSTFADAQPERAYREVCFTLPEPSPVSGEHSLMRPLTMLPFVPADPGQCEAHCREVINIQSTGLAKRITHTGLEKVTIGVSGGLDSTLALLVSVRAFDKLGLDRTGILAVSMPGPGTSSRTRNNAENLANLLGTHYREIPIKKAVEQHLKDIGHALDVYDITYENAQARERTQILMDLANQNGAFMVGTGDLSEIALGWCTYNADHMSMYHVNAGVPKTLVRHLIDWFAEKVFDGDISRVLRDITDTPITPELLPAGEEGTITQKTEAVIGPFELHDLFLFYTVRHLFSPRKVYYLASTAFKGRYSKSEILTWMKIFYQRFISQQFKRSAMPDGPKVGSVALSPRGDWRMPSDASYALWMKELEDLVEEPGSS
jgi:NAD+ synthase (glutamine-hydrolysing)